MEKVEVLKEEVTKALRERLYPLPPFGMQILMRGDEIEGAKVYIPLITGLTFDPESGDIFLGKRVVFQNGVIGKINGVYVQVRLVKYLIPGITIINR